MNRFLERIIFVGTNLGTIAEKNEHQKYAKEYRTVPLNVEFII